MTKRLFPAFVLAVVLVGSGFGQTFSDVSQQHWAHDAVEKAARLGLVVGRGDGTFKGDIPPTRYELAMGMSKILAEIENRMKARPIFTRRVLEQLKTLNTFLAGQVDQLQHEQRYLKYLLEHHYNRVHAKPFPDLKAKFNKELEAEVKRQAGRQPSD